jgi:hypothetical protein
MSRQPARTIRVLGTLLIATAVAPVLADDRGPIDQDIQVSLGGFFMSTDTDVRLDGSSAETGTDIDWEDEFDLADKDRFRLDAFWRFAERHKARLMVFQNDRGETRTLSRDIEYGGTTYPVNTTVDAQLNTTIVELAYEYAFMRREDLELSGSFGIHAIELSASLRGDVSTPGGGGSAEAEEEASTTGPLPVLGFRALWNIGNNFYLDGLAQFFYIKFNDFDGRLSDYKLGVTWFPTRNFGVGVAYNEFVTRVEIDKGDFNGKLRLGYGGPIAFVTVGFR